MDNIVIFTASPGVINFWIRTCAKMASQWIVQAKAASLAWMISESLLRSRSYHHLAAQGLSSVIPWRLLG